jgi:exopolysaccharide biosynthesis WecB/TagA/CpsF family protein
LFCSFLDHTTHQEIDMLGGQTQSSDNLVVDGITINVPSMDQAVSSIVKATQQGETFSVCTLNLDHVVQLQRRSDFRVAYRRARFVTADGFPIAILGRLAGTPVERTTGADLIAPLCAEAGRRQIPIYLLGSNKLTLHRTARRLIRRYPGLKVVGSYAPGKNFDPYSPEADDAIDLLRTSGARLCFLALGAPKQEIFAARCLDETDGIGFLCIGAGLDFIANTQARAPSFTQKVGLEWAWRMATNPRRLAPRYARCIGIVPRLVINSLPQILNARMRKTA